MFSERHLKRLPEVVMAILTSLLHHIKEFFDPFTFILQTCTLILVYDITIVYISLIGPLTPEIIFMQQKITFIEKL